MMLRLSNKYRTLIKIFWHLVIIICFICLCLVGYKLFIGHTITPIVGVILFLLFVCILIYGIMLVKRPSYRYVRPSFKLTVGVFICLFFIFAFAGIQPFSNYKDETVMRLGNLKNSIVGKLDVSNDGRYIPYGTYVWEESSIFGEAAVKLVLNSDWTYETNLRSSIIGQKEVGLYEITEEYITFINDLDKQRYTYYYRYSEQFKCLYLYVDSNNKPIPFYKD